MSIVELLFSFKGRVGRRVFWLWNVCYFLMIVIVATVIKNVLPDFANVILPWVLVLLVFPDLVVTAKRWHDRNKSRKWLLLNVPLVLTRLLIPVSTSGAFYQPTQIESVLSISAMLCGAWIFIECGFFDGDRKENKYGAPPTW